jgi:putative ABC transport system permease protein
MSGLMAVKLGRDLRASWPRFALMVVAIAISLTVFGGMLAAWGGVRRETSNAYMSTQPASATILLERPISVEEMAAIAAQARRRPQVIAATGRTQFDSDLQVNGQPRDIPLQVFVATPDDPMRMAKFDTQQPGSWPPSPEEIFLGRDALSLLGVAVGDTITIKTPSGQPLQLRVTDTVYDPSLSPSPQATCRPPRCPGPGGRPGWTS